MAGKIFRREKVEIHFHGEIFLFETNQYAHTQLSCLQRIRRTFRLVEIYLY